MVYFRTDGLIELLDVQDKRLEKLISAVDEAELEFGRQVSTYWNVYNWLEARTLRITGKIITLSTCIANT